MIIANPMYDAVFKYLLEDPKAASILISTLTGEKIKSIDLRPQEQSVASAKYGITVFRIDFKAIIEMPDGSEKKVLIELQKSYQPQDIPRFRRYLGENYSQTDKIKEENLSLPITTIYFLGFNLALPFPVIKVNRDYINWINHEIIDQKDDFIEQLTHDSYVVQIKRLPKFAQTKLEQMLMLFDQRWAIDADGRKWLLNLPDNQLIEDEDLLLLAKRLMVAASSREVQKDMKAVEELENSLDNTFVLLKEARRQKEEERRQKEEIRQKLLSTAEKCLRKGMSAEEVSELTGMDIEEVRQIAQK
jgi:hypothetical protein